jgi:hypothetical protein
MVPKDVVLMGSRICTKHSLQPEWFAWLLPGKCKHARFLRPTLNTYTPHTTNRPVPATPHHSTKHNPKSPTHTQR